MALTHPGLAWINLFREGVVTSTMPITTAGLEVTNAYDWLSFTRWQMDMSGVGPHQLDLDLAAPRPATVAVVFMDEYGPDLDGMYVKVIDKSTLTTVGAGTVGTDSILMIRFDETISDEWRLEFQPGVGTPDVINAAQVFIGPEWIITETGQHVGIEPPHLFSGPRIDTVISDNGSILATNVTRGLKEGSLDLEPVSSTWVRTKSGELNWQAFIRHATRFPFFYSWAADLAPYTRDTVWARATSVPAPANARPGNWMSVKMPLIIEDTTDGLR